MSLRPRLTGRHAGNSRPPAEPPAGDTSDAAEAADDSPATPPGAPSAEDATQEQGVSGGTQADWGPDWGKWGSDWGSDGAAGAPPETKTIEKVPSEAGPDGAVPEGEADSPAAPGRWRHGRARVAALLPVGALAGRLGWLTRWLPTGWLGRRWAQWQAIGDQAGRIFAVVTVLPVLMLAAWLVTGAGLLMGGEFLPMPLLLGAVVVAVGLVMFTARCLPGRWPVPGRPRLVGPRVARDKGAGRAAGWGLAGTVVVAAGFAAWQIAARSPQFIVSRDPGVFLQYGYWIAQHGSLPIPASLAAFGGTHHGLSFSSFGFAGQRSTVVPQFMAGLPIVLSAGLWAHGLLGGTLMSSLLGAFAVLAVGGLTGRLAGPLWAPAGALVLAVTLPEVYTSRSAFSETLAQALLFGGLCLVADSLSSARPRLPAAAGGLALGLTVLVNASLLLELVPAILFAGVLLVGRRRPGIPFTAGLLAGAGLGAGAGYALGVRFVTATAPALGTIGVIAAGALALTLAGAAVALVKPARKRAARWLAARPLRYLPDVAAIIVALALIGLAVRPYLQTAMGAANPYVASLQRTEHLAIAPGRVYSERSLYWLVWYLGVPALLLGVAGLAMVARICIRALLSWRDDTGVARAWALPAAIIGWGCGAVLWQPETVPDQPWASRTLVPVVLPGLVVLAVWAAAWLTARARAQGAGLVAVPAAAACFTLALGVSPAAITFGIGPWQQANPAVRLALTGLAFQRTSQGELGAVQSLCGLIPSGASAVFVDKAAAREFAPVVRGYCDVPTAIVTTGSHTDVEGAITGIIAARRRPVLLASRSAELIQYGVVPRDAVNLTTQQDAHLLVQPPTSTWSIHYSLWLSTPAGVVTG